MGHREIVILDIWLQWRPAFQSFVCYYTVLSSLFGVCVIVTSCVCQLDSIKAIIITIIIIIQCKVK